MCRAKGTEYWYHSVPLLLLHKGAGIKVSGVAVKSKRQIKTERKDYIDIIHMIYKNMEICSEFSHLFIVWNNERDKKIYFEDKCILEGAITLGYCKKAIIVIKQETNYNKIFIIEKLTGKIIYEHECTYFENKRNLFNNRYVYIRYRYSDGITRLKNKVLILDANTLEIKCKISSNYFNLDSTLFGFLLSTDDKTINIRDSAQGLIVEELPKVR